MLSVSFAAPDAAVPSDASTAQHDTPSYTFRLSNLMLTSGADGSLNSSHYYTLSPPPRPSVLMRLLRRNSMAALDLHVPAAAAPGGPAPELPLAGSTSSDIIAARSGAVLGGCAAAVVME